MRIGRLFGVTIVFNNLFLILMTVYGLLGVISEALTVFAIVLLHEISHSVAAGIYGIKVRQIELMPFGGVARLDGIMELRPRNEAFIAIIGPLNNLLLAGIAWLLKSRGIMSGSMVSFFIKSNLVMACFNMLPVLPLDGGRIFRALLSSGRGYKTATEKVITVSRIITFVIGIVSGVGFFLGVVDIIPLILAFFLNYSIDREQYNSAYIMMRWMLRKREDVISSEVISVCELAAHEDALLKLVIKRMSPRKYNIVMVLDDRAEIVGVLSESNIVDGLIDKGIDARLKDLLE